MYFKSLLRYRQTWLGFAMIWIIMYHLPLNFGIFEKFSSVGYAGVDICFFASGIGCFYSLSKNPDITEFIKRRLKRIMPTYLVFIIVWLIYKFIVKEFDFQMTIGNILGIHHFTGHKNAFNWYISAILLFYIFAPYLKAFIDKAKNLPRFLFLLLLVAFSIPFWKSSTHLITVTRIPIFYIGMLFANLCKKNKKISRTHIIGASLIFIIGIIALIASFVLARKYLWSHGLYWYPFILIIPPLCALISIFFTLLEKLKITKPFLSFLSLCGDYSFELYLVHVLLLLVIPAVITKFGLTDYSIYIWILGLPVLISGCFILRRISNLIICRLP